MEMFRCGHCQQLTPEFRRAALAFDGKGVHPPPPLRRRAASDEAGLLLRSLHAQLTSTAMHSSCTARWHSTAHGADREFRSDDECTLHGRELTGVGGLPLCAGVDFHAVNCDEVGQFCKQVGVAQG